MLSIQANLNTVTGDYHLDRMMRDGVFVPRRYKLCKSLGFEAGRTMPSRAFCAAESQGFPIILITKHSGTRVVQFQAQHGQEKGDQDCRLKVAAQDYCGYYT